MRDEKWIEKGLGDVKLLLNPATGKTRAVMRKERTVTFILNHHVQPDAELVNASSESDDRNRAFVYEVEDYSEGTARRETFALRFRSETAASQFSSTYREAQVRNRAIDVANAATAAAVALTGPVTAAATAAEAAAASGLPTQTSAFMSPVAPPTLSPPPAAAGVGLPRGGGGSAKSTSSGGAQQTSQPLWESFSEGGVGDATMDASSLDLTGGGGGAGGGGAGRGSSSTGRLSSVRWDVSAAAASNSGEEELEGGGAEGERGGAGVGTGTIVLAVALGAAAAAAVYWSRLPAGGSGRTNGQTVRDAAETALRRMRASLFGGASTTSSSAASTMRL